MSFRDIIGHKEIIKTLQSSLAEAKTGHAYLFLGPAGIGKKTLVREFTAQLLCPNQHSNDGCDCPSCKQFWRGTHPDFITVEPVGNTIKIEQLRELQHQAYLRPLLGLRKVFFFPEAELLTDAAANSFLKILEEPPAGVVFIFAAIRADHVLATIRSRCQVYQLFPVSIPEMRSWLRNKGFTEAEADNRVVQSQGLPGLALKEIKSTGAQIQTTFSEILRFDVLQLLKFSNELEKKERQEVLMMLRDWETQLRTNILESINKDNITDLVYLSEKLTRAMLLVESNVNQRLVLEEFFLAARLRLAGYNR